MYLLLTLHIKLSVILPEKEKGGGLFENSREVQYGASKLWQNHRQVQQTKERKFIF